MNLDKCERCGCFFSSGNNICPNCEPKDANEINQLKNFLNDSDSSVTVESLAFSTGISIKNVNRFLKDKDLNATFSNLGLSSNVDLNNNTKFSV